MTVYATGKTGTIGRKLSNQVKNLEIDLAEDSSTWDFRKINETSSVIHLAGVVGEAAVRSDLEYSKKINVEATKQLANILCEKHISQLTYVSTAHVYGYSENELDESSALNPIGHYSEQKLNAENILLNIFKNSSTKLVIIRVFSLLDYGMKSSTLGGAVEELLNGQIRKIENGDDIRDFLTPVQVARIIENISVSNMRYSIYNVCSGAGLTVRQAVQFMTNEKFANINKHINSNNTPISKIVGRNQRLRESFPDLDVTWEYSNSEKRFNQNEILGKNA